MISNRDLLFQIKIWPFNKFLLYRADTGFKSSIKLKIRYIIIKKS